MRVGDFAGELWQSVGRHKLRTGLTAFGIFWGMFLLMLLLGIGRGVERGAENLFRDDAVNSVWISGGRTSLPHDGYAPGREVEVGQEDLERIAASLKGVENLTPRKQLPGSSVVSFGTRSGSFEIFGVHPGYRVVEKTIVTAGRFLNDRDVQDRRKVAVIGKRVVEVLFPSSVDPVGQRVSLAGQSFLVVGTFTDEGGWLNRIYIPYSTLRTTFGTGPAADVLSLTTGPGVNGADLEEPIHRLLAARYHFSPADKAAADVFASEKEYRKIQALFLGLKVFVAVVGVGTLLAGAIGVSNIMLVTVKERTREIGIRKALGETPAAILISILAEALTITATAGYLGLAAGIGTVEAVRVAGIQTEFFRDPEVEPWTALAALGVLVVAGLVAGLLPARHAVAIRTIDALRAE